MDTISPASHNHPACSGLRSTRKPACKSNLQLWEDCSFVITIWKEDARCGAITYCIKAQLPCGDINCSAPQRGPAHPSRSCPSHFSSSPPSHSCLSLKPSHLLPPPWGPLDFSSHHGPSLPLNPKHDSQSSLCFALLPLVYSVMPPN